MSGRLIPGRGDTMKVDAKALEHLYQTMVTIRRFDEKTVELFQAGYVKGTAHSYVGQEAVAAGACAALRGDDYIVGNHRVVIPFFGDGGANQGVVHEAMNLASVWKLGVIFLCENNQYALSTATTRATAGDSIAARAAGYGMPGVRVDGNDVLAVYEAAQAAVTRARAGEGPSLIEAVTYRWGGHSKRGKLPPEPTPAA